MLFSSNKTLVNFAKFICFRLNLHVFFSFIILVQFSRKKKSWNFLSFFHVSHNFIFFLCQKCPVTSLSSSYSVTNYATHTNLPVNFLLIESVFIFLISKKHERKLNKTLLKMKIMKRLYITINKRNKKKQESYGKISKNNYLRFKKCIVLFQFFFSFWFLQIKHCFFFKRIRSCKKKIKLMYFVCSNYFYSILNFEKIICDIFNAKFLVFKFFEIRSVRISNVCFNFIGPRPN